MTKLKTYGTPDAESPEWTAEKIAAARPAHDVLADIWGNEAAKSFFSATTRLRGARGTQKSPTKERITMRLDADIVAHFRNTGKGWQSRLNDLLRHVAL